MDEEDFGEADAKGKNKATAKAKRNSRSLRDDNKGANNQKRRRGVGWAEVEVEKQISPLPAHKGVSSFGRNDTVFYVRGKNMLVALRCRNDKVFYV